MLRNAKVAAAIAAGQAPASEAAAPSLDQRVLAELAKIAFADIREVVSWQANVVGLVEDEDGSERLAVTNQVQLKSSHEIEAAVAAGIAEISQSATGALKIKMHPKLPALTKLGEHLGLFRPETAPRGAGRKGKKEAARDAASETAAGDDEDWGDDLRFMN